MGRISEIQLQVINSKAITKCTWLIIPDFIMVRGSRMSHKLTSSIISLPVDLALEQ